MRTLVYLKSLLYYSLFLLVMWGVLIWYKDGSLEKTTGGDFLFALLACPLVGAVIKYAEDSNWALSWPVVPVALLIILYALY